MPLQVLITSQAQSPNAVSDVKRRSANYTPSIWGDHFLSYAGSMKVDTKLEQHIQELTEEVKRMLMAPVNKTSESLEMIENIQRLGMSYLFDHEISEILRQIYNGYYGSEVLKNDADLYTAALCFRLLRQQGYNVSCDMFNKFKESNGTFKESLKSDVVGLLSLYEATHLRVHGEDILDEALSFTGSLLESAVHRLSSPLLKQVTNALYQPLWKGFQKIEARHFLSIYEEDDSHNETLLTLAKLDFNRLQKVHQKELSEITRWWKDLDFVNKLPFVRDRVVEAYFWALIVYFEPEYAFARMILCKYVCLATTVDDIYDIYGTYDELELFTEAIARWDIAAIDPLQDYMKVCYEALLNVYGDFEEKHAEKGDSYHDCIHYAREAFKYQTRAYFQEAKWLKAKYTPTMEEYISVEGNASFFTMATTSFLGMGALVTKDSMDWVFNDPKILNAASVIARLQNDMVGHKFEQKREHHASSVECYMNQYGVTEEEAKIELTKKVSDSWKDLNQEWLDLHSNATIPRPLLLIILNLARSSELLYKHEDVFTHPKSLLKGFVDSLFIEPVPV
ncbi:(-)-germacrene D synthase-like [Argentina anserina]|uniref:(-)-germacrene D synthase-like n=1 Tax=Argentina anserina TaxID=57926 RepID=UPI002176369B|nr:(-)-germacrene D synthase-like [Potentilla anserina]